MADIPRQFLDPDVKLLKVRRNGKAPVDKGWQKGQGFAEEQAEAWLTEGGNLGIQTGLGFIVLDVDVKNNAGGLESFSSLLGGSPEDQRTLVVKTPSSGYHSWIGSGCRRRTAASWPSS